MMGKSMSSPGAEPEPEEGVAVPEQQHRETQAGIIPQLCEDLFHRIADATRASSAVNFSVEACLEPCRSAALFIIIFGYVDMRIYLTLI